MRKKCPRCGHVNAENHRAKQFDGSTEIRFKCKCRWFYAVTIQPREQVPDDDPDPDTGEPTDGD